MQINNEQVIPLPSYKVWDGLNDPEILAKAIPGCEKITKIDDSHYELVIMITIGPVKARFNGKLTLSDVVPGISYSLAVQGNAGAAGFAKGAADVSLTTMDAGTRLTYSADTQVGGKLAQVGSRLIEGVAAKMAKEFFSRFESALLALNPSTEVVEPVDPPIVPIRVASKFRIGSVIAIAAIIAAIAIFAFSRMGQF